MTTTLQRRLRVDVAGVLGTTGITVVIIGLAQLLPAAAALWMRHPSATALFVGAVATALVGLLLVPLRAQGTKWTRRESLAIVALSWFAAIAASTVPFLASGVAGPVDALFESASGITTTGATVFPDVSSVPAPLHLWRALTQWIGGAGIVLIVFVITPRLGHAEDLRRTQRAEISFLTERYRGSTRATLRALFTVYVGATLLQTVILVLLGLSPWDALLHAFTSLSTAGFSPYTESMGAFGPAVQLVTVAFMLFGALNFVVIGRAVTGGGLRTILRSGEVRGYLTMLAVVAVVMTAILIGSSDGAYLDRGAQGVGQAFVDATFQVVAISTTTGFTTTDYMAWPPGAQVILLGLMFVGGCSGSTAGGIKFRRLVILVKHVYRQLKTLANPGAVIPIRLGEHVIAEQEVKAAVTYVGLLMGLLVALTTVVALTGSDLVTSGGAAISSLGNVGPGVGEVGPAGSWQPLAGLAKLVSLFAMLLGRLEVLPILAVLLPSFWLHRGRATRRLGQAPQA